MMAARVEKMTKGLGSFCDMELMWRWKLRFKVAREFSGVRAPPRPLGGVRLGNYELRAVMICDQIWICKWG